MPQVIYHRLIDRDIRCALDYYETEGGSGLADRFFSEVEAALQDIEVRPTSHHISDGGLRKAALDTFPYHFLYEVDTETIWIAVLRHDRRHPNYGLRRKRGGLQK